MFTLDSYKRFLQILLSIDFIIDLSIYKNNLDSINSIESFYQLFNNIILNILNFNDYNLLSINEWNYMLLFFKIIYEHILLQYCPLSNNELFITLLNLENKISLFKDYILGGNLITDHIKYKEYKIELKLFFNDLDILMKSLKDEYIESDIKIYQVYKYSYFQCKQWNICSFIIKIKWNQELLCFPKILDPWNYICYQLDNFFLLIYKLDKICDYNIKYFIQYFYINNNIKYYIGELIK